MKRSFLDKLAGFFHLFLAKQFLLFLLIGVFNTFNGSLLSFVFSLFLNANVAFIIGYVMSLSIAYSLNSRIVFRQKPTWSRYVKFCLSYLPNFIMQNLIVYLVYNQLGLHKLVAYLLAAALGVPITYLVVKFFAMATGKTEDKNANVIAAPESAEEDNHAE